MLLDLVDTCCASVLRGWKHHTQQAFDAAISGFSRCLTFFAMVATRSVRPPAA